MATRHRFNRLTLDARQRRFHRDPFERDRTEHRELG